MAKAVTPTRYYSKKNVVEAAIERIHWLFDEFENVIVSISGGKDSTVLFDLTLRVARERGRLPLTTMFIDQEAEWESTVDVIRDAMTRPDVRPRWYQMPLKLFNATSAEEHWLQCWDPAEEYRWMRPRESYAITENVYGTDRFKNLFDKILRVEYANQRVCSLAGVRCEESPERSITLTWFPTYKWATWGRLTDKKLGHYTLYPLYDWSYTDIWKYIHDNGLLYNRLYDAQYNYGTPIQEMRVSNVHHETAVNSLFYMQEVEPKTYERLTARISGIDTAAKLGSESFIPKSLPPMFSSWMEYRDYLLEHLIDNEDWKARWRRGFATQDARWIPQFGEEMICRAHIGSILTNDWEGIKLTSLRSRCKMLKYKRENA